MKKLKIITFAAIGIFLLLQFFRPEKNIQQANLESISVDLFFTDTVAELMQKSCFDCHSNHTNYPWYAEIAPVSWMLAHHVNEGKEHLNFSTWAELPKRKKIAKLNDICEEIDEGEMPLKAYLAMHHEAKLSPEDVEAICNWTKNTTSKIISGN